MIILAATLALALAAGTASTAQARGYTCTFKIISVYPAYVTLDGLANSPAACRAYKGARARIVPRAYGKTYCVWAMGEPDLRMTVRSSNRLFGPALCASMSRTMDARWHRIR
jgi:hypothetical protein